MSLGPLLLVQNHLKRKDILKLSQFGNQREKLLATGQYYNFLGVDLVEKQNSNAARKWMMICIFQKLIKVLLNRRVLTLILPMTTASSADN
jgi:hypothetical protein